MSFTNNDPDRLNQSSAHDTNLYDPKLHDNQIVAMYDTDAQARTAHETLVKHGIDAGSIRVVSSTTDAGTLGGTNAEDADSGVWGAIKSMFVPDDDRSAYSHAVGRGHAMLIVTPTSTADRSKVIHALESTDPVDFDAKLEEWRQAGYDTSTPHAGYTSATGRMTDERSPTVGTSAGKSASNGMGAAANTTPVAATATSTPATATTNPATATTKQPPATATTKQPMAAGLTGSNDETLKVMQERLRVGKREVAAGAVRVRSYVVERPVEEQVQLREEHVSIERNKVDRAANPADMAAFQERVIEARATSEEAVVSKEARVVEEIGLHKDVNQRTETVKDTLRETKVEIEGDGKDGKVANTGTTTGGVNPPRR